MPLTIDQLYCLEYPGETKDPERMECLASLLLDLAKAAEAKIPDAIERREDSHVLSPEATGPSTSEAYNRAKKKRRTDRQFEIESYHQRYIALEVMYVGWQYMGSTYQPKEPKTVEGMLLGALKRARLVAASATIESINLSRSGRTDRGVSGLGQVIALKVRSNGKLTQPMLAPEHELDYAQSLNKGLPGDIRVLGWCNVSPNFSARFDAHFREYRYFIPFADGELDLNRMQTAATAFLGQHDFRNFCKVDAEHIKHCVRHILDFRIQRYDGFKMGNGQQGGEKSIAQVHIRGSAFLWHQVRCMVAILILVGQGHETPDIVKRMLDVDHFGNKPQYNLADEEPLLFYSCEYDDLEFGTSKESALGTVHAIDDLLDQHLARIALLQIMAQKARSRQHLVLDNTGKLEAWQKPRRHIKLEKRGREASLEEKLAKFGKIVMSPAPLRTAWCTE